MYSNEPMGATLIQITTGRSCKEAMILRAKAAPEDPEDFKTLKSNRGQAERREEKETK